MIQTRSIIITIVIAQLFCTSLWFAGNAVNHEVIVEFGLRPDLVSWMTSAVQFGFIFGTLSYAALAISDKFSPAKVFFFSAIFASVANLGILLESNQLISILIFRFLVGFFLAGIYPVGMKIASDYFDQGLGKSLAFLIAALVLGTASPYLMKDILINFPWSYVIYGTSFLAVLGGTLIFFLGDGPHRKKGKGLSFKDMSLALSSPELRRNALGYFGHMWELYAFWAFVPIILIMVAKSYNHLLNYTLWAFAIIAVGAVGCVIAGLLSEKFHPAKVAFVAVAISGASCLVFPFLVEVIPLGWMLFILLIWGMSVIADSPMFSTLVAQSSTPELRGTTLTLVNCIGYALTIVSIQLLTWLVQETGSYYALSLLALGPILSLWVMRGSFTKS